MASSMTSATTFVGKKLQCVPLTMAGQTAKSQHEILKKVPVALIWRMSLEASVPTIPKSIWSLGSHAEEEIALCCSAFSGGI